MRIYVEISPGERKLVLAAFTQNISSNFHMATVTVWSRGSFHLSIDHDAIACVCFHDEYVDGVAFPPQMHGYVSSIFRDTTDCGSRLGCRGVDALCTGRDPSPSHVCGFVPQRVRQCLGLLFIVLHALHV